MHDEAKDIAVVLTGGTIGSEINLDQIDVAGSSDRLVSLINGFCATRSLQPHFYQPVNTISEDMSPADWLTIVNCVKSLVEDGFESIVVTHGTDTLIYTAAALDLFLGKQDSRIVMTGSFYSSDHPKSDVEVNLSAAIVAASSENLEYGVFVAFGDSTGSVSVLPAIDLKSVSFDGRHFESRYDNYVGHVHPDVGFRHYGSKRSFREETLSLKLREENFKSWDSHTANVAQLICYPGMQVDSLVGSLKESSIVLLHNYHSGTAPSISHAGSFIEVLAERDDLEMVFSPLPGRYVDPPYASTVRLIKAGAKVYKDLMPHTLYVYFTLGQLAGYDKQELFTQLEPWLVKV